MLDFIKKLPKTETHLHIEGSLPFQLLKELNPNKFHTPPESWDKDFKFKSFEQFESHLLEHALQWFTSSENYYKAAGIVFNKHLDQNVRYVETSFHSGMIEFLEIPGPEIIDAILSAVPKGLDVKVFMGMARNGYTKKLGPILEDSIHWKQLSGIDLHGVETLPIEPWAEKLWKASKDTGKCVKAHAGEFGDSNYVRDAIQKLGIERIEHGVRAADCEETIQFLLDADITLDVCPISNVKLNVIDKMENHPIRKLLDRGVRCTVSTDDPFSFGNSLTDEYLALANDLKFSKSELKRIAKNGFEIAWMPEVKKTEIFEEIDLL
jgi:adenosine deaminase